MTTPQIKSYRLVMEYCLLNVLSSSLYLFPMSTLPHCEVHIAIILFGYFAKLTLPFAKSILLKCGIHMGPNNI
jgi:hypothetical protein